MQETLHYLQDVETTIARLQYLVDETDYHADLMLFSYHHIDDEITTIKRILNTENTQIFAFYFHNKNIAVLNIDQKKADHIFDIKVSYDGIDEGRLIKNFVFMKLEQICIDMERIISDADQSIKSITTTDVILAIKKESEK